MGVDLAPQLQERALRLRDDLPFFAKNCLKIRTKTGDLDSFKLNRAQTFLHDRLERHRAKTGKVRAVVVKGRQLGTSTYIEGRFYHKAWASKPNRPLQAFILTHEQPATDNLFGMAQRFHEGLPEGIRPPTKAANAKELVFADSGCGYQVATAGTKGIGRSATFQLFHGSEVAYWPNAEDHIAGIFQTVGDVAGTEVILESTANGVGNLFYRLSMAAVRGANAYELIFIPWFWSEDYESECPEAFAPSEEWLDYAKTHELTWEQLYWAFTKNRELAQSINADEDEPCWKFRQEYPATFEEAFQSSGASFISSVDVLRARKPKEAIIGHGPIIIGVDPSRSSDKFGIIDRCGRRMGERICERLDPGGDLMYAANHLARIIDQIRPDSVNIDVGGLGAGVYDRLAEMGYDDVVVAVNFGSRPIGRGPTGDDFYFNRRAEMYDLIRDWFHGELPVQIPDDDGLHADLTAAELGPGATRWNDNNELILEEKTNIRERLGASPDLGDAVAPTFAVPFASNMNARNQPTTKNRRTGY